MVASGQLYERTMHNSKSPMRTLLKIISGILYAACSFWMSFHLSLLDISFLLYVIAEKVIIIEN